MDPLMSALLKEWGPWALTVVAAIRLWALVESEIKENRETRRERRKHEEATDEAALGHLLAIRTLLEDWVKRPKDERDRR